MDHEDSDDDDDDDDDIIDPVGDSDSDESAGPVVNPFPRIPVSRRGFGISRFRSDSPLALFLVSGIFICLWKILICLFSFYMPKNLIHKFNNLFQKCHINFISVKYK